MINQDPVLYISIVAVLTLLSAGWVVLFIKTWRERKADRFYREVSKRTPYRGPSRDRTLPGKARVKARRSRTW